MSKSIDQLTEKTTLTDGDLFHIVRSNVDYKIKKENVVGADIKYFSVTLTIAQILALDTTPQTLITAPGVGYFIRVESASARISSYGGTPYDTAVDLYIYTDTANLAQLCQITTGTILGSTVARTLDFYRDSSLTPVNTTQTQLIENKAILISPLAGFNPLNGNSNVTIYGSYRIIEI